MRWFPLIAVIGCLAVTPLTIQADESDSTLDVKQLVEQLDANSFSEREEATDKLTEAGGDAIPAVVKALRDRRPEVASRAFQVLKRHLQGDNQELEDTARLELEKVAGGSDRVAKRAQRILVPPENAATPVTPAPRRQLPPAIAQRIQIGGARQIALNNNGVKRISVNENGRKISIKEDPKNGIEIEVRETVDGKEKVRSVKAKDADDLKKQDADLHKVYEKYTKNQFQIQLNFGPGIQGLPQAQKIKIKALEQQRKQMEEIRDRLKKMGEQGGREDIKRALERFDDITEKLEKQIEAAEEAEKSEEAEKPQEAESEKAQEAEAEQAEEKSTESQDSDESNE